MVSLTTVYIVSVILASIAGMGSAFAGKKIVGGSANDANKTNTVEPIPPVSIDEHEFDNYIAPTPSAPPGEEQDRYPNLKISWLGKILQDKLDMPREPAQAIKEFIMTPVSDWKTIGSTPGLLGVKYKLILDEKPRRYYADITKIFEMVDKKYENMTKAINGVSYEDIGDQTEEAIEILMTQSPTSYEEEKPIPSAPPGDDDPNQVAGRRVSSAQH